MNAELNKIGILGLGTFSTNFYIQTLNNSYQALHGGYSTCPFLMLNSNFDLINPFLPNNFKALHPVLISYLNELNDFKVDKILLPNITIHEAVESLNWEHYSKIIHPIDESIAYLLDKGMREVVLIGTIFTMNSTYFQNKFESKGLKIVKPNKTDQLKIDSIRQRVYQQGVDDAITEEFNQLLQKYSKNKVVLIACTELSMVPIKKESDNIIDMADLQIKKALLALN